jgi:recombination protein RecA
MDIKELVKSLKISKSLGVYLGEESKVKGWLRSGMIAFDWLVSEGRGFPLGRIVEICGDYSAGKSYLAYQLILQAQKKGYLTFLFDSEVTYDSEFGGKLGIDNERLLVVRGVSVEKICEFIEDVLDKVDVSCVFVWDSVAATPTEKELEDGMDVRDLTKAQVVGRGFRIIAQRLDKTGSMLVLVNQLREKIGEFFGEKEFTPGGRALDYHSSVKIDLKRKSKIVEDKVVRGYKIHATVSKNRVDIPFRELTLDLRWDRESFIPWWEGLFEILILKGKVVEGGGWYRFVNEEKKWRASDFLEILATAPDRVIEVLDGYLREALEFYLGRDPE